MIAIAGSTKLNTFHAVHNDILGTSIKCHYKGSVILNESFEYKMNLILIKNVVTVAILCHFKQCHFNRRALYYLT